jgi:flavorubredoxin
MKEPFKAVKVSENVYWVGAIDWNLRDFHGYATDKGTTYNAYLIMADKITLIDTVKGPFFGEMVSRISSIVDPEKIDIIISNHSEMDHSGNIPQAIELIKPEKVYASLQGVKALEAHFHRNDITPVKTGDHVSLGNMDLSFIETKMLHWPDSMFSYLDKDGVLFSNDAFGMHLATNERFDDEVDEELLYQQGAKYYANIILPLSHLVIDLLNKVPDLNLNIKYIATDHGPVWRDKIGWVIDLYRKWAEQKPTNKAVITYDTMWNSTDIMGRAIAEGIYRGGGAVKVMSLKSSHRSDVITELIDAAGLIVGSPTINKNMFPTVADFLYYAKGLKPLNKVGASFGSFGWSGESVKDVHQIMKEDMKIEMIDEPLKIRYVPSNEDLKICFDLGLKIADRMKEKCSQVIQEKISV